MSAPQIPPIFPANPSTGANTQPSQPITADTNITTSNSTSNNLNNHARKLLTYAQTNANEAKAWLKHSTKKQIPGLRVYCPASRVHDWFLQ